MAEVGSSFVSCHSEKEENTKLINGCIAKGVWEKIMSSEEYKKIQGMELEELKAYLDPSFFPEGWLDKEPSPPKKKLKLSLSSKRPRFFLLFCCSVLNINHDNSQFAAFLLFNTPNQS